MQNMDIHQRRPPGHNDFLDVPDRSGRSFLDSKNAPKQFYISRESSATKLHLMEDGDGNGLEQTVLDACETDSTVDAVLDARAKTLSSASVYGVGDEEKASAPPVKPRAQWDSKAQFVLSLISYAVGLGNIWRFPYLCQLNGGGAFLVPYTISLITVGIPLFYLELGIGQKLRAGPIGAWSKVHPYLGGVGISSAIVSFLLGLYYNVIIAWCLFYLFHSFQGPLPWKSCPTDLNNTEVLECQLSSGTSYFWYHEAIQLTESLDDFGGLNWKMTVSLIICWIVVYLCVMKGIKSSGKVMCFTAIFPYIVLSIFFVRALMLNGAGAGVKYMFTPDFQKLKEPKVWLDGATQVFFSFGLAFGGLVAFASYNDPKNDCRRDTLIVSFANWFTALYASGVVFAIIGFMATLNHEKCITRNIAAVSGVFPGFFNDTIPTADQLKNNFPDYLPLFTGQANGTAFADMQKKILSHGVKLDVCDLKQELSHAAGGTGLAFITFTQAMVEFPGAPFWAVLFFLMLLSLGMGSMFGTLEGVITSIVDMHVIRNVRKEIIVFIICIISLAIGFLFVTKAGQYWVQLFDTYTGSFSLMAVALLEVLSVSYVYGWKKFCENLKSMTGHAPSWYFQWSWRFVAPFLMTVIFIASIVDNFLQPPTYDAYNKAKGITEKKPMPKFAIACGVLIVAISVMPIPIVALLKFAQAKLPYFMPRRPTEVSLIKRNLSSVSDNSTFRRTPTPTMIADEVTIAANADSGRGSLEDAIAKT